MGTDRINDDADFNVLGDVMTTLRIRGSVFFHSELAAPWGMSISADHVPRFHIALHGRCYVGADNMETVTVDEMDVLMLPQGCEHWVADTPGRDLVPSAIAGDACELGNPLFQKGDITNRLMCGILELGDSASHPIFEALPPSIHFPHVNEIETLWNTVQLIETEMMRSGRRTGPIIDRLTEVLFLQLLEHHIHANPEGLGLVAALGDRRLHLALSLIHQNPAHDWDLDSLGKQVGMSRATLNRRFQEAMGLSPIAYLGNWRLLKANHWVKHSNMRLDLIADAVGFASARTLSRAFKREFGRTPSEMRRSQAET